MLPHVIAARHIVGHRVWLHFDDGLEGELELADELYGPVFQPLLAVERFAELRVEGGTLAWPNGADLAPEYLHERVRASLPPRT